MVPVVVKSALHPKNVGRRVKFLFNIVRGGGTMGNGRPEAFAARYVLCMLVPFSHA